MVAAALIAGCGGSSTTTVISTTTAGLSPENQQVLDALLASSPDDINWICGKVNDGSVTPSDAVEQGVSDLSGFIQKQGGDPTVVVQALIDQC